MARIVVSENVSLDGVVEDPTGEEGSRTGGWFNRLGAEDREAWARVQLDEALAASALLFGRRSYEFFAARWPSRSGAWADRLNAMPKYVVTSTMHDPAWTNSSVLRGGIGDVATLKRELDGEIVAYASFDLVHALMEHELVDELRLTVYPLVLGGGRRLFGETARTHSFRLAGARTLGRGLASLRYQSDRAGGQA